MRLPGFVHGAQRHDRCRRLALLAAAMGIVLSAGYCQAASPSLSIIMPRGVQRGADHVLTFSGARLGDAQEVFFYSPGFTVTKIEPVDANNFKAHVTVAPDCRLGEHVAQVRTASGISDYRTFYVGALAAVAEVEPNTEFEKPQAVPFNSTVEGVVDNEDVDYYVIDAVKGQRISAEVEGMRLGTALFDPYVAILDSKRFELAAADDTALALQDCAVSVIAPEDGKYIVQIRESAYGGNGGCRYRLHIGGFPRPLVVYPAGGKLGESMEATFLGDPSGEIKQTVTLPAAYDAQYGLFAQDASGISPSGNVFRLFEHGNALEVEPNNEIAQGTPMELPLAMNGVISEPGDVDCFKFKAKKGEVYEVECYARRIRSPLDPVMNLYYADGRGITGADDARGPDSYFRFQVPEDAEYVLRVTDHLGKGGPNFVFRVEFTPVKPALTLGIPRVERYSQYRQTIYVPRGNRFAALISANRINFGGDLVLEGNDLPAGVKMDADPMPANLNVMPVVFEAAADAPLAGKLVDFTARHADASTGIRGGFENRADFLIGEPGQSLYRWCDVNRLAIAVVEELPFQLEIVAPNVPLVRNGSMQLKVVAKRKEGFTAAINVQLPFLPPGVGAASSVAIPEGQNECLYPLNANSGAQLGAWRLFALGYADINGPAWVSSQLTKLEIAEPYVTLAMERASSEQGQPAQIYCKLTHATPFEGAAKATIVGIPPKVTIPELEFTKDTQELVFQVATDPASPVGKHRLYCNLVITQNGEPITSTAGEVELQIDAPLPKPTEPAPAAAPAVAAAPTPAPAAPAAKPLSRLEKLRQAAKEKQSGAAPAGGGS